MGAVLGLVAGRRRHGVEHRGAGQDDHREDLLVAPPASTRARTDPRRSR